MDNTEPTYNMTEVHTHYVVLGWPTYQNFQYHNGNHFYSIIFKTAAKLFYPNNTGYHDKKSVILPDNFDSSTYWRKRYHIYLHFTMILTSIPHHGHLILY